MSLLAVILPAGLLGRARAEAHRPDKAAGCREQAEVLLAQARALRQQGHLQAAEQRVDEAQALLESLSEA